MSEACNKFDRMIGNEIHYWDFLNEKLIEMLKYTPLNPKINKIIGLPDNIQFNMTFDPMTQQTLNAFPKMRFIYLTTLFDGFIKEYIAERQGIEYVPGTTNLKELYFKTKNTEWKNKKCGSDSFYNLRYVQYILKYLYDIDFEGLMNKVTMEIGDVRNCIVHNNGFIPQSYMVNVKDTINYLKIKESNAINISNELLDIYIIDLRKIIDKCKY